MSRPVVRHGSMLVTVGKKQIFVRIMLIKYDGVIETYYQERGYPFEFAYGVASFEGFESAMMRAHCNAKDWVIHHDEL